MRTLSRPGVATRLIASFLAGAALTLLMGAIGLYASGRIHTLAETMYHRDLRNLQQAALANQQMLLAARAIRIAALAPAQETRDAQLAAVERHLGALQQALAATAPDADPNADSPLLKETRAAAQAYAAGIRQVARLIAGEPLQPVRASVSMLYREIVPLANHADALMGRLIEERQQQAGALSRDTRTIYDRASLLIVGLTIASALCAVLLGIVLTRWLMRQMGSEPAEVADIAHSIAAGDLSLPIDTSRAPPHSVLSAMAHMQESLRRIVSSVRASSDHIATGSSQIHLGNTDLAERTELQAADISETAAAMEEITGTVRNNAETARQAALFAARANAAVIRSLQQVRAIEAAIGRMSHTSRQIEGITALIEGIAFQTKILALNAGIEAARAGERGQGFDVVAMEVQALALRSSNAAREIASLVENSTRQAEQVASGIQAIAEDTRFSGEQIGQLNQLVSHVRASTDEQSLGLEQINAAVSQLSDITRSNAALVEEAAAASGSLAQQASSLVAAVSRFRLGPPAESLRPA
ncbi:methyl-accepting chemotaxis protein [Castellaniella defragrans]|uniref:Methyl-accepting chemotaxis protein I (Serine chemoreceptor protein) n=1 Tax=Castellaniella defragrans (strain DSM 12143 / CCUG 39792 / 65Phen) TaxID=1437824 RepID=W8X986_CASD6|nr:methyl-accepting chemotaxis protein [Castellaniella defragrans]CDM24390.1 Methyl-accepting chemotaxis protein I (serine chemoreceptor protein) [Castellaniella defragrans 65Phen]